MEGKGGYLVQRISYKEMVASHSIDKFRQWCCGQEHLHVLRSTSRAVPAEQPTNLK